MDITYMPQDHHPIIIIHNSTVCKFLHWQHTLRKSSMMTTQNYRNDARNPYNTQTTLFMGAVLDKMFHVKKQSHYNYTFLITTSHQEIIFFSINWSHDVSKPYCTNCTPMSSFMGSISQTLMASLLVEAAMPYPHFLFSF